MFDVTNFLMRWLFLCNLVRDVAEIQLLPYNPQSPPHIQQIQQTDDIHVNSEEEWRDNCLRGILSYPPGTQRLLVMDALRGELVQKLSQSLDEADLTLKRCQSARRKANHEKHLLGVGGNNASGGEDPYLDADMEIIKTFEQATLMDGAANDGAEHLSETHREALLVIGNDGTIDTNADADSSSDEASSTTAILVEGEDLEPPPSRDQVEDAQRTVRHVRDYLPQLVSVVLKSPPAFDPNLVDPMAKLRKLIVQRCLEDANWGIEMCWLLEAEVGRAWKTLFEHRQQTGKRLIVVLPAEKAAVLAKIGTEKREAFDLLQDAEQATAYGYTVSFDEEMRYHRHLQETTRHPGTHQPHSHYAQQHYRDHTTEEDAPARLPSSLSLRRCSHFGDTMHFIDRMTQTSLDLRHIPTIHRHQYLMDSLHETNRRLRRRMVTRGDVSLDVEDNRGPLDWPHISDVTTDMLRYSVHLPLEPSQHLRWPGVDDSTTEVTDGGVVRVLNIVADESILLSSRERCPFLIHVEVADTGLRGNDGRLYAAGVHGLGATVEEALAMSAGAASANPAGGRHSYEKRYAPYHIPPELLETPLASRERVVVADTSSQAVEGEYTNPASDNQSLPRGGWQSDEAMYYPESPHDMYHNPYDVMRQNELEQLHQQMYAEPDIVPQPPPVPQHSLMISTREALLYKVFGQAWADKCEEIRQASPYGKVQGWRLASFIMKAGEDIRQESLVMQIISKLNGWFQTDIPEQYRPHMRPYAIMSVGGNAGLVECLSDAKSIDEVKKLTDGFESLRDYFERAYGPPTVHGAQFPHPPSYSMPGANGAISFEEAQDNFLRSLVGYSLVCYVLQIKDRHNANILLDRAGNIIHIDFGFVLGDTPKMSKVPIFKERAPFKLSGEFWDVLGGWNVNRGGLGVRFCHMFEKAFACAAAHSEEIVSQVEAAMLTLTQSPRTARILANGVRSRLRMRGPPGSIQQKTFIMEMINTALTSWDSSTYDWLQKNMNGYQ